MKRAFIISLLMPFIFVILAIIVILPFALLSTWNFPGAIESFFIYALFMGSAAPISYLQTTPGMKFAGLAPFLIILVIQIIIALIIGVVIKRSGQPYTKFGFIKKASLIYFLVCIPFGIILFFVTTDNYEYWPKDILAVTTYVEPNNPEYEKRTFSDSDTSTPPVTRTESSNSVTAFVIPGKIDPNLYAKTIGIEEVKKIEQLALDRINIIMYPEDRQSGVKAIARIEFSSDYKLVYYKLNVYEGRQHGSGYQIKLRKSDNDWIIIHDGADSRSRFAIDY